MEATKSKPLSQSQPGPKSLPPKGRKRFLCQLTSATGILSLLNDPSPEIILFALERLDSMVNEFWTEIADHVSRLEVLYEDEHFPHREKAALLVSKVYYHLGSYDDSLAFALLAGESFTSTPPSEYYQAIIFRALDQYIKSRNNSPTSSAGNPCIKNKGSGKKIVDSRLESIVEAMFQRCLAEGQYQELIGISLECRRLDVFEQAMVRSKNVNESIEYAFKIVMSLFNNHSYRAQILVILSKLYRNLKTSDFIKMTECLIYLNDDAGIHDILLSLLNTKEQSLLAYQIGFDLYEGATQQFLGRLIGRLTAATLPPESVKPEDKARQERLMKLKEILSGDITIELDLQFLIRNNRTDSLVLKTTKEYARNSICHNATIIANGFQSCGTTSDQFLRENFEWLSKAVNWAKFSATASLGVIHKRHEKDSLRLMASYLPRESGSAAGYAEGGALYGLGLIHANHGARVLEYLLKQLSTGHGEPVKHGACLGIGLAALGTQNKEVYDKLKATLHDDDAVVGEAAAIAMGLVMLGSGDQTILKELISYARETQHPKIHRGLSIAIGLVVFSTLEGADWAIETLRQDVDPQMRRSGMNCIALAYCGSGSNVAIKILLNTAVSDVHDDVRRAAVIAIGFVMFRQPEQSPGILSPLLDSYHPHVRYGAALALGISCSGTGSQEALELLQPMIRDSTPIVRQATLIASAMIAVQHNAVTCPKSREYRLLYQRVITDRAQPMIVKFGAILAQGIIDAGGRNCTISLQTRSGHINAEAVVGMFVFTHFWYWFPLAHFISLSFTPTTMIALNSELKMPKLQFRSNAKPSMFAYSPVKETKIDKEKAKVVAAVLSITGKVVKKTESNAELSKTKISKTSQSSKKSRSSKTSQSSKKSRSSKKSVSVPAEPEFEILQNPARIVPAQRMCISMPDKARYKPVKNLSFGGVIMVQDTHPEDPDDIVVAVNSGNNLKIDEAKEPGPPEPFEYIEELKKEIIDAKTVPPITK